LLPRLRGSFIHAMIPFFLRSRSFYASGRLGGFIWGLWCTWFWVGFLGEIVFLWCFFDVFFFLLFFGAFFGIEALPSGWTFVDKSVGNLLHDELSNARPHFLHLPDQFDKRVTWILLEYFSLRSCFPLSYYLSPYSLPSFVM